MTSKKQSLVKRLRQISISQRLVAIMIIITAIVGFSLVGQGLYIKAKAVFAQVLLERAWSRALAGEAAPKAWPWADTWPVAKLNLPRIEQKAIVLNNASGEAMAFGPGLVAGTRLALATCWPFDDTNPGPLRYVIYAVPVVSASTQVTAAVKQPAIVSTELISPAR